MRIHCFGEMETAKSGGDSGDDGQRTEAEQQSAAEFVPLAVRRRDSDFAPRLGAERAKERPKPGQREDQEGAVEEPVERRAGNVGKGAGELLRQPKKPRRQQRAADEDRRDINDQRPERSHGVRILFSARRAKLDLMQSELDQFFAHRQP